MSKIITRISTIGFCRYHIVYFKIFFCLSESFFYKKILENLQKIYKIYQEIYKNYQKM